MIVVSRATVGDVASFTTVVSLCKQNRLVFYTNICVWHTFHSDSALLWYCRSWVDKHAGNWFTASSDVTSAYGLLAVTDASSFPPCPA